MHTQKTGLDSVVMKVCKKMSQTSGLRVQYDLTLKLMGNVKKKKLNIFCCVKKRPSTRA